MLSLRSIPELVEADVCITSPPYFQKFDYQNKGQHGLESSVEEYLQVQVSVFHEVQRLLHEGGTCFIVIGCQIACNSAPHFARNRDPSWA